MFLIISLHNLNAELSCGVGLRLTITLADISMCANVQGAFIGYHWQTKIQHYQGADAIFCKVFKNLKLYASGAKSISLKQGKNSRLFCLGHHSLSTDMRVLASVAYLLSCSVGEFVIV